MSEPISFADIEIALANHLTTELAARNVLVPVVIAVPSTRPKRFVRLVRVGGSTSNLVTDRPRIVAECWDSIGAGAADLARIVRALIRATAPGYIGPVWVNKVIDLGIAFIPDPDTNTPRYLVSAELHVRGEELT
ncbi:hypothetical protein SAMN04244553_3590 [Nocardia amikacinitolerans]|uniref:Tail terminator n=1 Tax=Nocardia amikacinitolerans TaxID=756689 RepID=A0A285LJ31_9NOCA|nr:hypothetical protein [Nocardia amikacinitolerans]SNY84037.1 hypothetical protein SAMN04244553_3590 [Nocardia amikacinitolerans]